MTSLLFTLLSFILVFAIVVLVHEFGHFWVARRMGVRVLRFSVGFGSIIWKRYDKHGTEFALSAIPLGGYVKMLDGREQTLTEEEKSYAFDQKPVLQRIAIVLAGPLFNFLFAICAYAAILMVGMEKVVPIIGNVVPDSPAARAGIQVGDEFVSIDDTETSDWQSVYLTLLQNAGDSGTASVVVRKFPNQPTREYQLPKISLEQEEQKEDPLHAWGITLGLPHLPAIIGHVIPDQPAARAGLQTGDEIIAVDDKPIRDWYELTELIRQAPGKELLLSVKRGTQTLQIPITPVAKAEEGAQLGIIGVTLSPIAWPADMIYIQREGPIDAIIHGVINTWEFSKLTLVIMVKMLTGTVGIDNLAGPISIAQGAQESAGHGWISFVTFLILLSVNLGVINLLPIPMLDGGHLLYYIIELVRGRAVSETAQRIGLFIGLALIMGLMLVGLHNDIMRLWK